MNVIHVRSFVFRLESRVATRNKEYLLEEVTVMAVGWDC